MVYGARDPADIEAIIRPKMLQTFPQLKGVKIDFTWTGNFLLTLSRLPQVGRLGDNIYYSQGCSGHGVTYTHLAGKVLAEALRGQAERFDAFAGLPHYPFPGGSSCACPSPHWARPTTSCAIASVSDPVRPPRTGGFSGDKPCPLCP